MADAFSVRLYVGLVLGIVCLVGFFTMLALALVPPLFILSSQGPCGSYAGTFRSRTLSKDDTTMVDVSFAVEFAPESGYDLADPGTNRYVKGQWAHTLCVTNVDGEKETAVYTCSNAGQKYTFDRHLNRLDLKNICPSQVGQPIILTSIVPVYTLTGTNMKAFFLPPEASSEILVFTTPIVLSLTPLEQGSDGNFIANGKFALSKTCVANIDSKAKPLCASSFQDGTIGV